MVTYFISGHMNITQEEFNEHYLYQIDQALKDPQTKFVVGDCGGADTMAQSYLNGKTNNVVVYHMFTSPRNNVGNYKTKGRFTADIDRDEQMTRDSDVDIAWVRKTKSKRISGTEKNLLRREKQKLQNFVDNIVNQMVDHIEIKC